MSSPENSNKPEATLPPQLSESRLLLLSCRYFLRDLMEMLEPELAAAIDFENVEFFSDECFDVMPHQDNRFRVDLAVRLKMTERAQEEEKRRIEEEQAEDDEELYDEDDEDRVCSREDFYGDEDDEDEDDDLYSLEHKYIIVHLVVEDEPSENVGKRLNHHYAFFFVEHFLSTFTVALFRSGEEHGEPETTSYVQESFGMEVMRFNYMAMGLANCRAENWVDKVSSHPLAAVLASRMGSDTWDAEQREQHLLEALDQPAPSEGNLRPGSRHFLKLVVQRARQRDPAAQAALENQIDRILSEEPTMAQINVSMFEELLRTFFADVMGLIGGHAAERLDYGSLQWLDDEEVVTKPSDPPDMKPALFELLAAVSQRGAPEKRILLHVQLADGREDADDRTMRRHMQLRLKHPGSEVRSFLIFLGKATGSGVSLCEAYERSGDDVVNRFRFRAFTLAANSGEDYVEDPRPVAWALAALMPPWMWKKVKLKIECLVRILRAHVSFEQRKLLWSFVQEHLLLEEDEEERVRKEILEQTVVMRETLVEYFDQRYKTHWPRQIRDRLSVAEDPMEVFSLMEDVYTFCVEQGWVQPEEDLDLPVH